MNPAQHAQGRWALFGSSWRRALIAQFHPKILLLPLQPIVLSIVLWLGLLWLGFERLSTTIHAWLSPYIQNADGAHWLAKIGSFLLQHALLPLLAGWLLLPLMLLTSLIFIGVLAMPVVVKRVGQGDFPRLTLAYGGTLWGSVWISCKSALQFCLLWLISLPLCLIPGATMILHPLLMGWLSYRVMSYDAMADHASEAERLEIKQNHRAPLIMIGTIGGLISSLPSVILLNGGMLAFPLLAVVAIWVYVSVFIFIGLWFAYYCLAVLEKLRAQSTSCKTLIE